MLTIVFCVMRTAFKPEICVEGGLLADPGKLAPGIHSCYSTALHRRATESTKMDFLLLRAEWVRQRG